MTNQDFFSRPSECTKSNNNLNEFDCSLLFKSDELWHKVALSLNRPVKILIID